MKRHEVVYRSPFELTPSPINLRTPTKSQSEHLVPGIRRFGVVLPVLINGSGQIVAGHGIVEAAKVVGLDAIPTITLEHLSDAEARALRILINKVQEMSKWNKKVLTAELAYFAEFNFELVTFTGFSSAERESILDTGSDDADDTLPEITKVAVTRPGDLWHFKEGHRLGCLDALEGSSYDLLLAGERAGLAIVDAPYNCKIKGHVTSREDVREFVMAAGEMKAEEFMAFNATYLGHLKSHSKDGALLLSFMDWRGMAEMLEAGRAAQLDLLNLIVWSKTNPGMGSLWRSAHELCFAWKSGDAPHVNQVELGRNGRNRSNVWSYPGANAFSSRDDREGMEHVTPKNVAMIQDAILDVSRRDDIVLDCFAGSGTTLVAAHRAKRRGYGLEFDPIYVDLAVRRMEARTNAPAYHAETGLTFAETAAERGVACPTRPRRR